MASVGTRGCGHAARAVAVWMGMRARDAEGGVRQGADAAIPAAREQTELFKRFARRRIRGCAGPSRHGQTCPLGLRFRVAQETAVPSSRSASGRDSPRQDAAANWDL